jgi:hypothetical protein
MATRNELFPIFRPETRSTPSGHREVGTAGPTGLIHGRRPWGLIRFLLCQAGALGVVVASIALDGILRPSTGVELAWQAAAFFAALFLSWRGLARFVPDLDRRWRVRRRRF